MSLISRAVLCADSGPAQRSRYDIPVFCLAFAMYDSSCD